MRARARSLEPSEADKLRESKARRAAGIAKMLARARSLEPRETASTSATALATDDAAAGGAWFGATAAPASSASEPPAAATTSTSWWGSSGDSSSSWWGGGGAADDEPPPLTYEEMTRAPPPQLGLKYVVTRVDVWGLFAQRRRHWCRRIGLDLTSDAPRTSGSISWRGRRHARPGGALGLIRRGTRACMCMCVCVMRAVFASHGPCHCVLGAWRALLPKVLVDDAILHRRAEHPGYQPQEEGRDDERRSSASSNDASRSSGSTISSTTTKVSPG